MAPVLPLKQLYCIRFQETYDERNSWRAYPNIVNKSELLIDFLNRQPDAPESKLMLVLLIPLKDLKFLSVKFSHSYKESSATVSLSDIMSQGGVCLVFEGKFLCL